MESGLTPELDEVMTQYELNRLVFTIQSGLTGQLRDFHLERAGDSIILTGRASSFYVKQLAQHLVMKEASFPIQGSSIEVS